VGVSPPLAGGSGGGVFRGWDPEKGVLFGAESGVSGENGVRPGALGGPLNNVFFGTFLPKPWLVPLPPPHFGGSGGVRGSGFPTGKHRENGVSREKGVAPGGPLNNVFFGTFLPKPWLVPLPPPISGVPGGVRGSGGGDGGSVTAP
jgi:hypothetical protein